MKVQALTLALSVGGASAFVAPSTSSVGKTSVALKAEEGISESLPWAEKPVIGKGDMAGDFGFDPLGLRDIVPLSWSRAAELKHGRVCMLAAVGLLTPELVQNTPGFNGFKFAPEFTELNPFTALGTVPRFGLAQIVLVCGLIEIASFASNYAQDYKYDDNLSNIEKLYIKEDRTKFLAGSAKPQSQSSFAATDDVFDPEGKVPGDLGFDPIGFAKDGINPDYATAELKHGRLAMLGTLGMLIQAFRTNEGVVESFNNWYHGSL